MSFGCRGDMEHQKNIENACYKTTKERKDLKVTFSRYLRLINKFLLRFTWRKNVFSFFV